MGRKQTREWRVARAQEREADKLAEMEKEVGDRFEAIKDLPVHIIKLIMENDMVMSREKGRLAPREQFDNMVNKVRLTLKAVNAKHNQQQ